MNKEIENLEKEAQQIIQEVQQLDTRKNQLITRLAEIQGVIKYLKEKESETKKGGK